MFAYQYPGKVKVVKYKREQKRYRSIQNTNKRKGWEWVLVTRQKLTRSYPQKIVTLEK